MSSVPATNTEAGWIIALLQAGDSLYPTGGYAHSFGLEGLVQEGAVRDRATLREFLLRSVLPALEHAELPLTAHAWRALGGPDWSRLAEISFLCPALKTAAELRRASESIGRQRVELAVLLHGAELAREYLARAKAGGWPLAAPIAAALEGRVAGAPLAGVLAGFYYSNVSSVLAAAMKLLRLGQNGAQSLLTEALAQAPGRIAAAETVALEEVGWFNPWLDIAAARHERADARLFIS